MLNKYCKHEDSEQYEPRIFKEIMNEVILNSEMPFYSELRQRQATAYPNTEPGVDLKLMTQKPGRIPIGEARNGILMRDGDDHFCFVEKFCIKAADELTTVAEVCLGEK